LGSEKQGVIFVNSQSNGSNDKGEKIPVKVIGLSQTFGFAEIVDGEVIDGKDVSGQKVYLSSGTAQALHGDRHGKWGIGSIVLVMVKPNEIEEHKGTTPFFTEWFCSHESNEDLRNPKPRCQRVNLTPIQRLLLDTKTVVATWIEVDPKQIYEEAGEIAENIIVSVRDNDLEKAREALGELRRRVKELDANAEAAKVLNEVAGELEGLLRPTR